MQVLQQSTATTVLIGPVFDSSSTAVTSGLLIGDLNLTKAGTTAAMAADALTHNHNGHWLLALASGDVDTTGRLTVSINKAGYAMPPRHFTVLPASTFTALVSSAAGTAGGLPLSDASGRVKVQGPIPRAASLPGFQFDMVLSSDGKTPATGKTVTATRSLDGAAFAACTNGPVEIGGGTYKLDLSAADLNAAIVELKFAEATCLTTIVEMATTP